MSGFHPVCTLCAGFLLPWLLSSNSSSLPKLHLLACFQKGSVPDANPTGNGLGCTSQGCQGAARSGGEGRQWLTEVFVEQGFRLCSPSGSWREPLTNHSLVCKETTDQWSGCHWLLVQSKDGQKHLSKLGGSLDVWDVECLGWASSTSLKAP